MSSEVSDGSVIDDRETRFEGYSDYQAVSRSINASVDNAVEAYATIQSRHSEGLRVQERVAAEASSHILGAAMKLLPELEDSASTDDDGDPKSDADDVYTEILANWLGDDGYIERCKQASFVDQSPDWLHEFVYEIRSAGFHLGYLKAGRETPDEDIDWVDSQVENMFD